MTLHLNDFFSSILTACFCDSRPPVNNVVFTIKLRVFVSDKFVERSRPSKVAGASCSLAPRVAFSLRIIVLVVNAVIILVNYYYYHCRHPCL